jgi:MFS family permease
MTTDAFRYRALEFIGLARADDPAPTPEQVKSNAHHLVMDTTWFGIFVGTCLNLMSVYIVRLGAPSLLVSAVVFGPALVSIFWQLPATGLMNRTGHRMRWVIGSLFWHRFFYLIIALLPFFIDRALAPLTVLLLFIQAFPLATANTSFLTMMADAIPKEQIPNVVGLRLAGLGLASTVTTLVAGRVLQWVGFPLNYQIIFLFGWLASMVSVWHVTKMVVPESPAPPQQRVPMVGRLPELFRYPGFALFTGAVTTLHMAIGMTGPLLPIYWARTLGATDGQISIVVTTASGMMVVGSLVMRRLAPIIGRERAVALGAAGYALYPLLTSFSPTIWWVVPWAALGGMFTATIFITLFDNLVSVTPNEDRTTYIGVYSIFVNSALVVGPLLAGVLGRTESGLVLGLRLAAMFGFLAALLFVVHWRRQTRARAMAALPQVGAA